ncbi:helix-turn-helix domain-containing protein [Rhodopseudomonas sp.]|uniref:helix-turn-helix domain-containing protein n=1 Tax=Rhodopseudomonas sp. TaxID=1078 RepID=UPI0039E511E1
MRIKDFRLRAGLTQTALATALGISFQQVQKVELGQNRVGAGRLLAIAECPNVPVPPFSRRRRTMGACQCPISGLMT